MAKKLKTARTVLSLLVAAIGAPQLASALPLTLVQYPAGSASRAPAPNVILTLDDSGSMGSGQSSSHGMYVLKDALQDTFSAATQNVPDGTIRLAWNTFNKCRGIPNNTTTVGCVPLRVLDDTHRTRFLNWVGMPGVNPSSNQLSGNGNTPTHAAYKAAGDYIADASNDSSGPWAAVPPRIIRVSPSALTKCMPLRPGREMASTAGRRPAAWKMRITSPSKWMARGSG